MSTNPPVVDKNGTGGTVALTYAEPAEGSATVAPAVDADPVRALKGAARDGLLTYHGSVSGGRFEVEVAGRPLELPRAEVTATVERLRAVADLAQAGVDAELVELLDDGTHVVRVAGQLVRLAPQRVVDWCAGYAAGQLGDGLEHDGEDRISEIAKVLNSPSRDDQCRIVILGLMHGRPVQTSRQDLADRVGKAKKTVVEALTFGNYLSSELAEKLIAAFGLRWSVSAGAGRCERAEGGEPLDPMPEMPGLVRLRRISDAVQAGWLRYVDEPSPNRARRLRRYRLTVGPHAYVVTDTSLDAWLDGLAAHRAAVRPEAKDGEPG